MPYILADQSGQYDWYIKEDGNAGLYKPKAKIFKTAGAAMSFALKNQLKGYSPLKIRV